MGNQRYQTGWQGTRHYPGIRMAGEQWTAQDQWVFRGGGRSSGATHSHAGRRGTGRLLPAPREWGPSVRRAALFRSVREDQLGYRAAACKRSSVQRRRVYENRTPLLRGGGADSQPYPGCGHSTH